MKFNDNKIDSKGKPKNNSLCFKYNENTFFSARNTKKMIKTTDQVKNKSLTRNNDGDVSDFGFKLSERSTAPTKKYV